MKKLPPTPKNIVDAILADLTDRRGLRQAWEEIDEDIREEIKECWMDIVSNFFSRD